MATSHRKDLKLGQAQREMVNFSVKAQDMILRAAAEGGYFGESEGGYKTTDDLLVTPQQQAGFQKLMNSIQGTNITTNISQDGTANRSIYEPTVGGNQNGILGPGDLLLPSIKSVRKGQPSPFRGAGNAFFDMPMMLATQKMMRQTVRQSQNGPIEVSKGNSSVQPKGGASPERATHSADRNNGVKMNSKVLETWINETLQDAEHLDIPGVILKPEHKNPISRYGIDRLALTNAGIPNEMVDRIFRALFVYSVGFYELIKKCLQHTERKYSIITAIWKVFSILLEYCCKTDYRMLISEISKEHKEELDRLEREFQQKFNEQAENERRLKSNLEILQKYSDDLEKEKNSERQMRLKLEEEYMQNTKNHEEEVQLRLKFESKLNNMHSVHRDLETKYKRALSELAGLQTINEQLYNKNGAQADEITQLKTVKAEMESKISYNDEKIAGLQREVNIKVKQVQDLEGKFTGAQDELDMTKYKLQELMKDLTEHRLKIDVFESQVTGLKNEKQHLQLELKETKELQKVYEKKCSTLISEMNKIQLEAQESKREIIGFGEIQKEREERIEKLKAELKEVKTKFDEVDLQHGTLTIQHEKVREQYDQCKLDLDNAIEKLHLTNKVRHETELKLTEEQERCRSLQDVIRDKDEQLHKRAQEIEDLDKRVIELERANENVEVKKAAIERQFEITKKQLQEKIQSLQDVLASEKETREQWIERFEKEQKEHTSTNAKLLQERSNLKDQMLLTKNVEIKLQTTTKSNEVLSEQNKNLQDQLNDSLAKQENLEREVNTQKEIMKQMELNRKEYIQKLKTELSTVEQRYQIKVEQMEMIGQDYLSRAAENVVDFQAVKARFEDAAKKLSIAQKTLEEKSEEVKEALLRVSDRDQKIDGLTHKINDQLKPEIAKLEDELNGMKEAKEAMKKEVEEMAKTAEQKKLLEKQLKEVEAESKSQRAELSNLKKQNDRLAQQIVEEQERVKDALAQAAEAAKVSQPHEQRGSNNGSRHQIDGQGSMKQPSKDSIISNKQAVNANASDRTPSEAASKTLLQTPKESLAVAHQRAASPKGNRKSNMAEHSTQTDMQMKDVMDARTSPLPMMMLGQGTQVSPAASAMSQQQAMMLQAQMMRQASPQMQLPPQFQGKGSPLAFQQQFPSSMNQFPQGAFPGGQIPGQFTDKSVSPLTNYQANQMMGVNAFAQTSQLSAMPLNFQQQMQFLPGSPSVMSVPVLDDEGKQVLDENGQPQYQTVMAPSQLTGPGGDPLNVTHGSSNFNTQNQFFQGMPMMVQDPETGLMKTLDGQFLAHSPLGQSNMQMNFNATTQDGSQPAFNSTVISPLNNTLLAGVSTPGQSQQLPPNIAAMQQMMFAQQQMNQLNQMQQELLAQGMSPDSEQMQSILSQQQQAMSAMVAAQSVMMHQHPIMEQQNEDEPNAQRSIHSQQSATLRQGSINSKTARTSGNRMPVEFKNMNSVLHTQNSQHSNMSGSNKSLNQKIPGVSSLQNGSNQMLPAIGDRSGSQQSSKHVTLDPQNSKELQQLMQSMTPEQRQSFMQQQQQNQSEMGGSTILPPISNTRMKVEINSTYGDQRQVLNSGGGVHTPVSQMSGYSQPGGMAPSQTNQRFQPPPGAVAQHTSHQQHTQAMLSPTTSTGGGHGGHPLPGHQAAGATQPQTGSDRKVVGKSSIRTLIKAAATRD